MSVQLAGRDARGVAVFEVVPVEGGLEVVVRTEGDITIQVYELNSDRYWTLNGTAVDPVLAAWLDEQSA